MLVTGLRAADDMNVCAGQASLFTMSADNAMVQFISRGAPRILESQVLLPSEACARASASTPALQ